MGAQKEKTMRYVEMLGAFVEAVLIKITDNLPEIL